MKKMRVMLLTTLIVTLIDQISKFLVVQVLGLKTLGAINVWPPYLNFHMAWNRGVNFGLFSHGSMISRWFLIVLALAISVWVASWAWRERMGWPGQLATGLVVGGALGNVIDRLFYGAVADFLNMSCCGVENPFAFNVADISIFIGAFGLVLVAGRKNSA